MGHLRGLEGGAKLLETIASNSGIGAVFEVFYVWEPRGMAVGDLVPGCANVSVCWEIVC